MWLCLGKDHLNFLNRLILKTKINVALSNISTVGYILIQSSKVSGIESSKIQVYWIPIKYIYHVISVYYNLLLLQFRDQYIYFTDENIEDQSNYKAR